MSTGEKFALRVQLAEGRASLETLNSLTKYPSIPTYHPLGDRGRLRDVRPQTFTGIADLTEKIDGTNARVITLPDGTVVVGSREELLWSRGDLIANPQLGIVDTLRTLGVPTRAESLLTSSQGRITVVYGEVYGAGVGPAGRRYAGRTQGTGFRVFDVATVPVEHLVWSAEEASAWRKNGGQSWCTEVAIDSVASSLGVRRVPGLGSVDARKLPRSLDDTAAWLRAKVDRSRAPLFTGEGSAAVPAEGVVIRGFDPEGRRLLAKARFEDYRRTLRTDS